MGDVTMTLAVTQQGNRKDTPLGTCVSIPHTLRCHVLPYGVPGTALRSFWLHCCEKQISCVLQQAIEGLSKCQLEGNNFGSELGMDP